MPEKVHRQNRSLQNMRFLIFQSAISSAQISKREPSLERKRKLHGQGRTRSGRADRDLVVDRISKPDAAKGYVLDGFPRTIPQAEALTKALEARGEKIDYAINVEVPDENIVHRMGGRRACIGCGATYHVEFNAPKVEDVCDTCGGELVLRDDDKPETVQKRLSVYHAQTQPLIDYYKKANVLVEVDGTQDINVVFQDIVKILGA